MTLVLIMELLQNIKMLDIHKYLMETEQCKRMFGLIKKCFIQQ